MQAVRNLLRAQPMIKNVAQQRNMSVICTPARTPVSKGETIFLASLMVIGWSIVPAWVLCNIKHYRDRD